MSARNLVKQWEQALEEALRTFKPNALERDEAEDDELLLLQAGLPLASGLRAGPGVFGRWMRTD